MASPQEHLPSYPQISGCLSPILQKPGRSVVFKKKPVGFLQWTLTVQFPGCGFADSKLRSALLRKDYGGFSPHYFSHKHT